MKHIHEQEVFLKSLMDLLEQHFGRHSEFVLHDLTKDYNHTIVDIRNGHITGRRVGDCGSNLGLEILRGTVQDGERYNYITQTPGAKILRSSSLYMRDAEGKVIGSLCINTDITTSLQYEAYLHEQNHYKPQGAEGTREFFTNNVQELLERLLLEGAQKVGKAASEMTKEERCRFIKYLDEHGAFLITKSGERTCEYLGISKYTLYATLEKLRNGNENAKQQEV